MAFRPGNPGVWGTAGTPGGEGVDWDALVQQYMPGGRYGTNTTRWRGVSKKFPYGVAVRGKTGKGTSGGQVTTTPSSSLSLLDQAKLFAQMFGAPQEDLLKKMLDDSARRTRSGQAALGGFGQALQGYAADLWGATAQSYRDAAQAQSSLAAGLGGQVSADVAAAQGRAQELAQSLGYTAPLDMVTPEAAGAQIASEGGARTGETIGQVGTAWGGYGATRPDTIGFMTGQNQYQLAREQIEADNELRLKFAELGLGNLEKGLTMAQSLQKTKSDASAAAWDRYMDRQKLGLELKSQALAAKTLGIKDKQFWAELNAKQKQWDAENAIDWENLGIAQQNANTARIRARTTGQGKSGSAYNSVYSSLYKLAAGGENSPLYERKTSGGGPFASPTVTYVKKPRAQARAALLARAQPFLANYPQYTKQIMADIDDLLDTMGWPSAQPAQGNPPTAWGQPINPDDIFGSLFPGLLGT